MDRKFNFSSDYFLCPKRHGACVYQARALYNTVYKTTTVFPDNCEDYSARRAILPSEQATKYNWQVKLFPNPTASKLNVVSSEQNENLEIEIKDLSGRLLLKQSLKTKNFIFTLELTLINGAYLVSVENAAHEKLIKKLLISK